MIDVAVCGDEGPKTGREHISYLSGRLNDAREVLMCVSVCVCVLLDCGINLGLSFELGNTNTLVYTQFIEVCWVGCWP